MWIEGFGTGCRRLSGTLNKYTTWDTRHMIHLVATVGPYFIDQWQLSL